MLELKNIEKNYKEFSLKNISLSVEKGDYYVLLGESGAGKSLILEIVAGLIKPDGGNVFFNEQDITRSKIQDRRVGLVFQDYAVFPHLRVKHNIAYSLKKQKKRQKIWEIVHSLAEKLEIEHLLERKPETLSGGELQRVALARTLIMEPEILLLDEPLSSLDESLKDNLGRILRKLNREGITIIHVTHDYQEAVSLATKVGIIHNGKIIQKGRPDEVFNNPRSKFVARFTGIKNFYKTKRIEKDIFLVDNKLKLTMHACQIKEEGNFYIRPEDVKILPAEQVLHGSFKGVVIEIIPNIRGIELVLDAGIDVNVFVDNQGFECLNFKEGDTVWIKFNEAGLHYVELDN